MALIVFSIVQLLVLVGAGALIWRRFDKIEAELASVRTALAAREAGMAAPVRRLRTAEGARFAPVDDEPLPLFPEQAAESAPPPARASALNTPTLSPDSARGFVLAIMATAPALGFFFDAAPSAIVASGLAIAATTLLIALRPVWRAAGWAGAITAAGWVLIGFALGAAQAGAAAFSAGVAAVGCAGLMHAHMRRAAPGLTAALMMGAAALALGSQTSLIGPAGAAFAFITAAAATIGALSLRLEGVHLAAFGAALIGLFVLSGQPGAAIWFTPAVTWAGALFFAIAAVRAPQLGANGAALAGTGTAAPLAAIAALYFSRHGLGDPLAAAAALIATAIALALVLTQAARRDGRGLAALKLTSWILALGAFAASAAAITLALPAPFAAGAFMALALGFLTLDGRWADALWRTLAWAGAAAALINGAIGAQWLLSETSELAPMLLIFSALAAPAVLAGGAAFIANRNQTPITAGLFETVALALGIVAASLTLRALVTGGALVLTPISFAEAGLHMAIWLAAALVIAGRANVGAQQVRRAFSLALGGVSIAASLAATLLWLTPHWATRAPAADASPMLQFHGLGFLAPAILFWAHWVFWRATGSEIRTRLALGAAALLTASLITLEVLQMRDEAVTGTDWLGAIIGGLAFALAIGINFAPGITLARPQRPLYFEENLQRNRRRQLRRQAR